LPDDQGLADSGKESQLSEDTSTSDEDEEFGDQEGQLADYGDWEVEEEVLDQAQPAVDYTKIPLELEARFDAMEDDGFSGSVRPVIMAPSDCWSRARQIGFVGPRTTSALSVEEQSLEKQAAFGLLDALSRSGDLTMEEAELHVIVAFSQQFPKTLVDTVIQDNSNPIEAVERTLLTVGSQVFDQPEQMLTL
jgi:hypothetical protein